MKAVEQTGIALQTREFLMRWGLKQKFVAETCGIPETAFSGFINGKLALSRNQLARVTSYMNDYESRNS